MALTLSCFDSLEILILTLLSASFAAFFASAFVRNASSSSIHGKLSSSFIHAEYILTLQSKLVTKYLTREQLKRL